MCAASRSSTCAPWYGRWPCTNRICTFDCSAGCLRAPSPQTTRHSSWYGWGGGSSGCVLGWLESCVGGNGAAALVPLSAPGCLARQTVRSLCRYGVPRRAWTIGGLPVGGRAKMRAEHNLRLIQVAGRLRYGYDVPLPAPISTPRCRPSSNLHHRPRHCTTWDTSSLMRECGLCPSLLLLCVTGSLYSHV